MLRRVHVVRGDGGLYNMVAALGMRRDEVVRIEDNLGSGPVRQMHSIDSWSAGRISFWHETARTIDRRRRRRPRRAQRSAAFDYLGDYHALLHAEEIVVWLSTSLADQLMLTWIPELLKSLQIGVARVAIAQFERTRAGHTVADLGLLDIADYKSAPATRAIDRAELEYLGLVWKAVTSPQPMALLGLLAGGPSPLPVLTAALPRLLWRYPDLRSGVNRYEARLLIDTPVCGPHATAVIGSSLRHALHEQDAVEEHWLWWRVHRLSDKALHRPAISLTGKQTTISGTGMHLTATGEQVVRGELNLVTVNGIDEWVGGVHLDSRTGQVWFYEDGNLAPG